MSNSIYQLYFDSRKLVSIIPPAKKIIPPTSTSKELGEFTSNIVSSLWFMATGFSSSVSELTTLFTAIFTLTKLSSETVFISMKYFQKFLTNNNGINFGLKKTYLISLIIADKYHNDRKFSQKVWTKITEIPLKMINDMELTFLKCLNFEVYINGSEHKDWIGCLAEYIKAQQEISFDPPKYLNSIMADIQHQLGLVVTKKENIEEYPRYPLGLSLKFIKKNEELQRSIEESPKYPPGLGYTPNDESPKYPPGLGYTPNDERPKYPPGLGYTPNDERPKYPPGLGYTPKEKTRNYPPGLGYTPKEKTLKYPPGLGYTPNEKRIASNAKYPPGLGFTPQEKRPKYPPGLGYTPKIQWSGIGIVGVL
ncbi:hypothetical protein Glove_283g39 [Diversispora epigaea]|uniref:Cyclin N-terminal domain-containing protein n=1 Tax=Diversispora epigaea TaxID=1348612 RepID=A0A397I2R7_9GLOM|nr:hypothetical protein Glove_283g39 [Diversispora epigaea]